jgi:hypothetical protein
MHELDHHPESESRYSCDHCQETGIDIESREYCTACELGKRRMNLDRLTEPLRHHPFTNAMWVAHHSAMKTERAIAAAEMALLKSKLTKAERELAEVRKDVWQPIETAPKDGTSILVVMQGYTPAVARWLAGMWMTAEMEGDFEDDDLDACEWNLTHWMPLPTPPAASVAQANKEQE